MMPRRIAAGALTFKHVGQRAERRGQRHVKRSDFVIALQPTRMIANEPG
jgi:hypothetical protein